MILAAIDIGTNAIRLQITRAIGFETGISFKKLEIIRFPLRLGEDVFRKQEISYKNEERFLKLMNAFKQFIDLYQVDDLYACATSAMRESTNGEEIRDRVYREHGIKIHIIDGQKEANILSKALIPTLEQGAYIHIDVGGGSTELNIYHDTKKIASQSFKIGTVRMLQKLDRDDTWKEMEEWIKSNAKDEYGKTIAIGTGGNISKICDLANRERGSLIPIEKVQEIQSILNNYTLRERINVMQLKNDRADVIVPAAKIYLTVMQHANAKEIVVPGVGLKDGIMQMLYDRNAKIS